MRFLSICIISIVLFSSCFDPNPIGESPNGTNENPTGTIVARGNFNGVGGHFGEGEAQVLESGTGKVLFLKDFGTNNGPDLYVYLSASLNDDDYIDLGVLIDA